MTSLFPFMHDALSTLPLELSNQSSRANLLKAASNLPNTPRVLLECSLDSGSSGADFSHAIIGSNQDAVKFLDCVKAHPEFYLKKAFWADIVEFCQLWIDQKSPIRAAIKDIWFEFDTSKESGETLLPGVGLTINNRSSLGNVGAVRCAIKHAKCLFASGVGLDQVDKLLLTLPTGVRISHVGIMRSRKLSAIRINLRGFSSESAWKWMCEHVPSFSPPSSPPLYWQLLWNICALGIITIDVGVDSKIGRRVGVEFVAVNTEMWRSIFDLLCQHDLCDPIKLNQLKNWLGRLAEKNEAPRQSDEVGKSNSSEPSGLNVCHVNHLKLCLCASTVTQTKIYIWIERDLPPEISPP